jgi:glycosyltransferase involved in cell wall biosynthesis
MDEEEKSFGRKRVKKTKPILAREKEQTDGDSTDDSKTGPPAASGNVNETTAEKPERRNSPVVDRAAPGKRPDRRDRRDDKRPPRRNDRKDKDHHDRKKDRSYSKQKTSSSGATGSKRINVSVIIPAFNEEENIRPLAEMFDNVIRREGKDWEVVLVNDGSTDKTLDRCREMSTRYRWMRTVSYSKNRGLTAALNAGFEASRGSILVFYPADLQYHAQDIPAMLAKIRQGADLVAGWKQGKYSKRLVSYVYNRLCRFLFKLNIHDMNSVKAFKRDVVKGMSFRKDWHRYMVVMASENGFEIDEVKVKLYPRKHGKSKFGLGRILGGVLDLFSVKFQITFLKKPLRFFGTWGIITGGLGFILGLIALYLRFFTIYGSRTLLFPTILLVLAGLLLFAIGFLAEVLVGLKDEIESLKSK